ncbi:MAG TPA: V-type ATP synthase subunit B, partial [Geomonas sp.]
MRLSEHIYRTVSSIRGPLLFADRVFAARIGEIVRISYPGGETAEGEILKIDGETVLIQVYGETRGLDLAATLVFTDAVKKA